MVALKKAMWLELRTLYSRKRRGKRKLWGANVHSQNRLMSKALKLAQGLEEGKRFSQGRGW